MCISVHCLYDKEDQDKRAETKQNQILNLRQFRNLKYTVGADKNPAPPDFKTNTIIKQKIFLKQETKSKFLILHQIKNLILGIFR